MPVYIPVPNGGMVPHPSAPDDPPRPAPDLSLDRAILRCEHKGPPACSCNAFATCGAGKGHAGQVLYQDCRSCQAEARAAT